ncbi:MAG: UDP-4-amino-4-deoxy-L-arabinose--oxoglutarate aminotransferase [Myxococcota bacterium]|nr:UDP-4-amino-4-deoxy-L-arabinose--oxoglutarate aminotransferase [Myxococcota bacterium]
MSNPNRPYFAHESAYVDEPCEIGEGTKIWHFCHVLKNARIGRNCVLGQNVSIADGVVIGDRVKIQNNVSVYTGTVIEDEVFLGPSCVLTNVTNPRSQVNRHSLYEKTLIRRGASIGANATIVCGTTIGRYAFIAAGAVVAKDAPDYALMAGVPARQIGWMSRHGHRLTHHDADGVYTCPESGFRYKVQEGVMRCLDLDEEAPLPENLSKGEVSYDAFKSKAPAAPRKVTSVPLLDLKRNNEPIEGELREAFEKVLREAHFIMGPEVKELETECARYTHCKHAIGVSSGTDAILLALMALDTGPGDEVICPTYTFFATAGCIWRTGAKPVFVDSDPWSYNCDPEDIRKKITPRTKAIMPVHLYGQCADMDPILALGREFNIPVIEDAAQAIGSEYKGRAAGSMGAFGCFSFFPSKNLGGFGDGGLVTANDDTLAEKARVLRAHGSKPKYFHKLVGGNFRLDTLNAALLLPKLRRLDEYTLGRQRNARLYTRLLLETGLAAHNCPASQLPQGIEPGPAMDKAKLLLPVAFANRHIYNQYVIRAPGDGVRDALMKHLKDKKIGTEIYYPRPMHLQECFAQLGHKPGDMPHSERAANETFAVPVFPELTEAEIRYVVDSLAEFFRG